MISVNMLVCCDLHPCNCVLERSRVSGTEKIK